MLTNNLNQTQTKSHYIKYISIEKHGDKNFNFTYRSFRKVYSIIDEVVSEILVYMWKKNLPLYIIDIIYFFLDHELRGEQIDFV